MKEKSETPSREKLVSVEEIKARLGAFAKEIMPALDIRDPDNYRIVDEMGFCLTGIPVMGPELERELPHIDIMVDESVVTRSLLTWEALYNKHPKKIVLPVSLVVAIAKGYGLDVSDLLKRRDKIFQVPTARVSLGEIEVLVPEPVGHVRVFAEETLLSYNLDVEAEYKIMEWFTKLRMIRDVSKQVHRFDVSEVAQEMITLSQERWSNQGWGWLSD